MGHSLWIRIISLCCMFCDVTSSTVIGSTSVASQETTEQTKIDSKSVPKNPWMIFSISLTLVVIAGVIITVLVLIYRRKRGGELLQHESVYYGNSEVLRTVEHNGYKSTEAAKDNYKPEAQLPPKEEPIYINMQHGCSQEPKGDGPESIYCNINYDTHKQDANS